jgi:hypothetical protein
MFLPADAPLIENTQSLETLAHRFINIFFDLTGPSLPPTIKLKIRNGTDPPDDEDAAMHPPVVLRTPNGLPVLYLRSQELVGRPASVMEGGLAMELAVMVLQQEPGNFRLNFEREILPMFNVSGSAVQFLRRLVMHLETGLKRFKAVQLVIDAGYGGHLFYYYYHTFQLSDEDRQHYDKLVPRQWMRAMYLAQKSTIWMPLTLLDEAGIASGLRELWRDCHAYLVPEDHRLLTEIADIPRRMTGEPFATQTAAMSKKIMAELLS